MGVLHDLIHYVVETTLGYREAFFGLLAAGWDIQDFGAIDRRLKFGDLTRQLTIFIDDNRAARLRRFEPCSHYLH